MASFQYIVYDQAGQQYSGTMEANSESEAMEALRAQGYYPSEITPADAPSTSTATPENNSKFTATAQAKPVNSAKKDAKTDNQKTKKKAPPGGGKIKPNKLTIFTRQLATLIDASLPLHRALIVLRNQESSKNLKHSISTIADSVQSGTSFSDSLAQYPNIFDKLYVNMAKAGEAGGVLEVVLTRLAEYMEKAQKLKGKIQSAMTYPIAVILIALSVLTGLMYFIVPQFKDMFTELEIELPSFSKAVFGLSDFALAAPLYVPNAVLIFLGLIALSFLYSLWIKTVKGRELHDTMLLKLPIIGGIQSKTIVARFSRTLGTLVQSGVPILQALQITRETAGNVILSQAIDKIYNSVREGEAVAMPMRSTNMFPEMVTSMVEVGEEIGQLPNMLMKVADVYEEEVDNSVNSLTSIIEPVMIIFLALIVASVVFAVFLPMFSITDNLG